MAATSLKSPLTERHYTDLKRIQKSVKGTLDYLVKCRNCKLDVDEEIEATKDQLALIDGFLKEFFPNQPKE